MKHTRIHINKTARSLFLLVGVLAVTVWGYGQDSETSSTGHVEPFELVFNNSANEGNPSVGDKYQGFVHEKEEIIYLAPGDRVLVEVCGTGKAQIDNYVRWYVDPEASYSKDIKEYMDVYKPVNEFYNKDPQADAMLSPQTTPGKYNTNSRYLYYKEKDKRDLVTGYLHHTGSSDPKLRYVYLKAPETFELDEYVIYCDLGKTLKWNEHLYRELNEGKYIANRINLRRKYIIRNATKMATAIHNYNADNNEDLGEEASFFGKYEIHAPIEANYITLRLPHALSNYYTNSGSGLAKPDHLHWSFYKSGEKTPVYQVKTKYENSYTGVTIIDKWDGLIKLDGHNVHLRAHVLDVAMNMLQISEEEKKTRQTYTVVAALGDDSGPADNKKIVTITLNLEPNYKALTENDFTTENNPYQFRSEEILEKYYKSLGNISFNNPQIRNYAPNMIQKRK